MQIHSLSDTHNKHKHFVLPGGDILLHAGDVSGSGEEDEILPFLDWYADQDYSHIVLVAGNHDWGFEKHPEKYAKECADRGIILLNDSGYVAEGINIWGSPVQPWFCNWAFNRHRGEHIAKHWAKIPENTEILITHGPPFMIGDSVMRYSRNAEYEIEYVGDKDLTKRIKDLPNLKLHVSGHIHEGRGIVEENGVIYVNASALDQYYKPVKGVPIRVVKNESGLYVPEQT